MLGIALTLLIALGSMVILIILILPIQQHGMSFHLFVSSSISFISVRKLFWSTGPLPLEVGLFLGIFILFWGDDKWAWLLNFLSSTSLLAFCLLLPHLTHWKFTYPVRAHNSHTDCSNLPFPLCCPCSILSSSPWESVEQITVSPEMACLSALLQPPVLSVQGFCWLTNASSPWMMQSPIHPFFSSLIYACI